MNRLLQRVSLAALLACFVAGLVSVRAEDPDKPRGKQVNALQKGAGTPRYSALNINNLWTWHRSDGLSNHSPASDNGLYYPKFTSWAIYQDGMMWGGKVYRDANFTQPAPFQQLIRVGGAHYSTGTQAGRVIGFGANAVAQNPDDADVRMYRIRRDYAQMSEEELRADAAIMNEIPIAQVTDAQMQAVKDQYEKDWKEWPVQYGAPYIDRNRNGRYDPPPPFSATFTADSLISQNRDEPGVAGADPNSPADQVLWCVFNDLNRALTTGLVRVRSEPIGLEIQKTLWGYKRTDAMGNLYFQRYKIINKGGVDVDGQGTKGAFYIDSMYVTQWSDPDLGGAGDDVIGCDTVLSLGFVYNGVAIDLEYQKYNLPPPSAGYDFLAGPIVPAPGQTAVFDLKYRPGYRNLPMTGFSYFSAGSQFSDPPDNYQQGTIRWYKMMRGFVPLDGPDAFYPHPPGVTPGRFPFAGDPVRGTGHLDGQGTLWSFSPGDRRILLNTGPFRMAPGDTQEVTTGIIVGLGSDRISSVAVMKFNDRFAQNTYNALFAVPKAPLEPDVKVVELDEVVVLEWGSNRQRVADIEDRVNNPGQYTFEGYNVYQLPSRGASLKDARRLATFDLPTDPAVVLDEQFDQASGLVLFKPVQFGSNSGIQRTYRFTRDYIRDIEKLYNGQEYYLAVTAYAIAKQEGYLPAVLESTPTVYTVRPQVPFGKVLSVTAGDTLRVTQSVSGNVPRSDGIIRPIVINPLLGTGHTYRINFQETPGGTTWSLTNVTQNRVVMSGQKEATIEANGEAARMAATYKPVEGGVYLQVDGPPPGMKGWEIPSGARRFTWADGWAIFEGFEGTIGWADPAWVFGLSPTRGTKASDLKKTLLKLAAAKSGTQRNPNAGNNPYGGWDENNPGPDPNFSYGYRYLRAATAAPARPEFAPYRVNPAPGYAYQDYKRGVPLSAWNMDANPPVRLAVGHLENNVAAGLVDGKWWPGANGTGPSGSSVTVREWLFIFDRPYTAATPVAELQRDILNNSLPVMWFLAVQRRGGTDFFAGDEFLIIPNYVNTPAHSFTYSVPAPESGAEVEKRSAEKVNVYPNPYYGFNPAETSRFARFVTFNNLPRKATIRIFNLAGQLVRTLEKDDDSQFFRWNLMNQYNFPVASGMYIAHVDMPDLSMTKTLKLAVIQEQEVLDVY
jgi:hypothetical protein